MDTHGDNLVQRLAEQAARREAERPERRAVQLMEQGYRPEDFVRVSYYDGRPDEIVLRSSIDGSRNLIKAIYESR